MARYASQSCLSRVGILVRLGLYALRPGKLVSASREWMYEARVPRCLVVAEEEGVCTLVRPKPTTYHAFADRVAKR